MAYAMLIGALALMLMLAWGLWSLAGQIARLSEVVDQCEAALAQLRAAADAPAEGEE